MPYTSEDKNTLNTKSAALKEAISKNDVDMMNAAKEDLQKALYEVSTKLYQQANPQGQPGQPTPDMGANPQGADGNVYDYAYGLNWSGVIKDWRTEKYSPKKR